MRLRSNELCPIHRSFYCCGRELVPKPKLIRLGIQKIDDPYHPRRIPGAAITGRDVPTSQPQRDERSVVLDSKDSTVTQKIKCSSIFQTGQCFAISLSSAKMFANVGSRNAFKIARRRVFSSLS
jgi:hypothetical protein